MDEKNPAETEESSNTKLLIVVVVVATLLAVYFVPDSKQKTPDVVATAPAEIVTNDPIVTNPSTPTIEPEVIPDNIAANKVGTGDSTDPVSAAMALTQQPGSAARALIARVRNYGDLDLGSLYSEAQRHQKLGAIEDAYLLYFFAAREGHPESALTLAEQSDPETFDVNTSVFTEPDVGQAFKWFNRAATGGLESAHASVDRLRSRLEADAAAGDAQAQRLVLQWQQ